jgi:C4-type Zn-finger protein
MDAIEQAMYDKGYLTNNYIAPAKTIETDIRCPVCGEPLTLYVSGNSHRIKCKTDSCVMITFRGL